MSLYENRTPEMQAAQILRYVEIRYDAKDREEYLRRFLGEIFERVPGLRGHFVGLGVVRSSLVAPRPPKHISSCS